MKIANIRTLHDAVYGKGSTPDAGTIGEASRLAQKRGVLLGSDGRAYAPFKRATPLLPNGRHGRWEKGKVVPRSRTK